MSKHIKPIVQTCSIAVVALFVWKAWQTHTTARTNRADGFGFLGYPEATEPSENVSPVPKHTYTYAGYLNGLSRHRVLPHHH